jgi:hypothetical protein
MLGTSSYTQECRFKEAPTVRPGLRINAYRTSSFSMVQKYGSKRANVSMLTFFRQKSPFFACYHFQKEKYGRQTKSMVAAIRDTSIHILLYTIE